MCATFCAMVAQTTGEEVEHTWIDLGLPSGVKWASTNIGANRPQDLGNYYAWGETTLKTDFRWATYSHGTSYNSLTKYNNSDGLLSLDATDDAASTTWGGAWRMPTKDEWAELQAHCVWTCPTVQCNRYTPFWYHEFFHKQQLPKKPNYFSIRHCARMRTK